MLFQKPGRSLMERQLDYDVVPADQLERAEAENGRLRIGSETYYCLILPYCERIADRAARKMTALAEAGVNVWVIDRPPERTTLGEQLPAGFCSAVRVVSLQELPELIPAQIRIRENDPHLRLYRYAQGDAVILMVMNESLNQPVQTELLLPETIEGVREYDAMSNRTVLWKNDRNGFPLLLEPGQSRMLILTGEPGGQAALRKKEARTLEAGWRISVREVSGGEWKPWRKLQEGEMLPNINGPDCLPRFCGTIRYEASVWMEVGQDRQDRQMLYLPEFGDSARVWVNDSAPVTLLRSPARTDVTEKLTEGENRLRIEVTNTPVWTVMDPVSTHIQLGPTGMTQKPVLELWSELR